MTQELLDQIEPFMQDMRDKIIQTLKVKLPPALQERFDSMEPAIRELISNTEKANAYRAIDMQSAGFTKMSSALLAIYRALEPEFEERQSLLRLIHDVLKTAFYGDGMDAYLEKRFGIVREKPEEAWDMVCRNFKAKGEEQFGEAWTYEQGIMDARRCFVNVRKCGFSDFLLANDARELLYVMCVLDYDWADALEEYGVGFERPTILAEGSDACRFQFFKRS